MDSDSSDSSDEELELMAFVVAAIAKKKRKRRIWVREIFQMRQKLVSLMKIKYRIAIRISSNFNLIFVITAHSNIT